MEAKRAVEAINLAFEFAFNIIIFGFLGYYIGKKLYGSTGSAIGVALGIVLGFLFSIYYVTKRHGERNKIIK